MKHLPLRECGYAIVGVVLLVAIYGSAYLSLMQRTKSGWQNCVGEEKPVVTYRFGEEGAESFFAPAHEIDRMLRPDLWWDELSPAICR